MAPLERLLAIMARLRDPNDGCEWDRAQTFSTIAPYTIEEAYEVADAIERDDMADLRGELGDLLLQVVFHARMAQEAGLFAFDDVAAAICAKLEARHPHIFGAAKHDGQDQTTRWEQIKAAERKAAGAAGALDGIAHTLPAMLRAEKLQKRAARTGFDWPDLQGPADKLALGHFRVRRRHVGIRLFVRPQRDDFFVVQHRAFSDGPIGSDQETVIVDSGVDRQAGNQAKIQEDAHRARRIEKRVLQEIRRGLLDRLSGQRGVAEPLHQLEHGIHPREPRRSRPWA